MHEELLARITSRAGEIILSHRSSRRRETEKQPNEIVTEADVESERYIVEQLQQHTPDIPIYAEEGLVRRSTAQTRWIVDPLDGTTPWVWGNSGFAVSIALEVEGAIACGAVYDPVFEEFYYAAVGKGATRNGSRISVAEQVPHRQALLVVDWGNSDDKRHAGLAYFEKFMKPKMFARRVVPQFAPALGLCRLAEGRIHGVVCNDTWVEDHAAASLIVCEAGGVITNFDRQPFTHRMPGVIATNCQQLHDEIVQLLEDDH